MLTSDLDLLECYFRTWCLRPNPDKTVVTAFHLNNKDARKELNVSFCRKRLAHEPHPKYLGVTLDRTLAYRPHLTNIGQKLKTRVNLVQKLAGTSWGSTARTLRTATVALIYSAAEYCSASWAGSRHTKIIDVQLNAAMRIVTGTLKSTPTEWLLVLAHITPPAIRRDSTVLCEMEKIMGKPNLPIHKDLASLPQKRLKSRWSFWETAANIRTTDTNPLSRWTELWDACNVENKHIITDPTAEVPGFDLPRRHWSALNRIRTGHRQCGYLLYKWKMRDNPKCDCGHESQTMEHITTTCPLRSIAGGTSLLHLANQEAIEWIDKLDI
ncbi:uncharacterized protein LOC135358253 [Latimeria chalumnae]|uniref:uncharacterized protein LOC135358253 n=1 Tax=Latimeria chalumnae TaxID=7897 RepID=UPI00313C2786